MGLTMRPSAPALSLVGKAMATERAELIRQWTGWVTNRVNTDPRSKRPEIERQLGLLVDIMVETTGPLRRQVAELWLSACELHGVAAAERGLAAGEVVEELQHLRELLIRHLSEVTLRLPPRQGMATVIRLNRFLDKGITRAVVGYTDALVRTLFDQNGVAVREVPGDDDITQRVQHLQDELKRIRETTA